MTSETPGPDVRQSWQADRATYIRDHLVMAAFGAIVGSGVLYFMGNPDFWVCLPAALLAVGVRGWYLASEELTLRWDLTATELRATNGRRVFLSEIAKVRTLGSAAQIVTRSGDKYLMKYMANPGEVKDDLARAAGVVGA